MNPSAEEVDDAGRDTLAFLRAMRAGDDLGAVTILDHADLPAVAEVLGGMVNGLMTELGRALGYPEDAIDGAADQQLLRLLAQAPGQP